jgi:hypothetical protein
VGASSELIKLIIETNYRTRKRVSELVNTLNINILKMKNIYLTNAFFPIQEEYISKDYERNK